MKKLTKKLMLSILTVALTFIALGTSTFAWFSMNSKVAVTGMNVKTKVSNNLLIATSSAGTTKAAEAAFGIGLDQTITGLIYPSSTISAEDDEFYYTFDAKADGSKAAATSVTPYEAVTSNTISDGAAYKDYIFELKAINTSATDVAYVNLTKLNLLYDGKATTVKAFRVAFFVQNESGDAYAARGAAGYIMALSGATYFTTGQAVSSTTEKAAVSPALGASALSLNVPAGQTKYYKITVRLWLEGEDTDCFNTKFVDLTNDWTLDINFELQSSATAAQSAINSSANLLALSGTGNSRSVAFTSGTTLENGETAVTYQWYKVVAGGVDTVVEGATTSSYTATAAGSYYCKITTAKGNTYITETFTYTA